MFGRDEHTVCQPIIKYVTRGHEGASPGLRIREEIRRIRIRTPIREKVQPDLHSTLERNYPYSILKKTDSEPT